MEEEREHEKATTEMIMWRWRAKNAVMPMMQKKHCGKDCIEDH
jgi:hypothetical protein